MKTKLMTLLAMLVLLACDREDSPVATSGSVAFVVNSAAPGAGRTGAFVPEKLVLSVEDNEGKTIFDNKAFTLTFKDNAYRTETMLLDRGNYRITRYLVISGETATFATPKTGAPKASLISRPLPMEFEVSGEQLRQVAPEIVGISSQDVPQNFGYNDFGYQVPSTPATDEFMNVRIKLEMYLGAHYYPSIDAIFKVKAFDAGDQPKWEQDFAYVGPQSNDFKIKTGFQRYRFEVTKWGKSIQISFTGTELWEGRVREGVVPLTRVFQASAKPKKVLSTVSSFLQEVNHVRTMVPSARTTYEYEGDVLKAINYFHYEQASKTFVADSRSEFLWEGDLLVSIENRAAGSSEVQARDLYSYDAMGRPTRIQHLTGAAGPSTDVQLSYRFDGRIVNASYSLSNGAGFQYELILENGSIKSDKSTRGSQLCSAGTFINDKNVNPLKHLGYVDYLLRNYSLSNRVAESVQYVGCSFPSLVPESYSYVYDEDGYPLKATTNFAMSWAKSQTEYTYE